MTWFVTSASFCFCRVALCFFPLKWEFMFFSLVVGTKHEAQVHTFCTSPHFPQRGPIQRGNGLHQDSEQTVETWQPVDKRCLWDFRQLFCSRCLLCRCQRWKML
jgi:hypothetical protein